MLLSGEVIIWSMNKQHGMVKMISFKEHWAEYISLLFIIIAFFILLFAPTTTAAFFIIFLGGVAGGRVFHESKYKGMFPHFLITLGPWIGFILADSFGRGFFGWKIVSLIYFVSYYLSYKVHSLGIIP